ncbi:MAG TPA: hypothetical protein VKB58_14835 [Terriglobales bacterium]|nr:hypothetical protein [Terriglobales bacterium]
MADSETQYIVELQPRIAERLGALGFGDNAHAAILAHSLAEIVARGRTLEQQALPLFLTLDARHRREMAEVAIALKNHLDGMQDAITDVRSSLAALSDFLVRESAKEQIE